MNFSRLLRPSKSIRQLFVILLFTFPIASFAQAGCCSHHGGVSGCDTATNHLQCKDGSDSPSCACKGTSTTRTQPTTKSKTTPSTKTQSNRTAPAPVASTKGCCSRHGGVAECNKSTGYQVCKDGTQSGTCNCP